MSVPGNRLRGTLRAERNRQRLHHTAQRLELVIAALRERPADRVRRTDVRPPTRENRDLARPIVRER